MVDLNSLSSSFPEKGMRQLEAISKLSDSVLTNMLKDIAVQLVPFIKQELAVSFALSGIHNRSGQLFDASVQDVQQELAQTNFKILLSSGFDRKVYVRAAVFKYGAVYGGGGRTFKKKFKKNAPTHQSVVAPKPPFFSLSAQQMLMLSDRQAGFLQTELRKAGAAI